MSDINPVRVHQRDRYGNYPLHYAEDEIELTRLLARGANPNTRNYHGASPLHYASSPAIVTLLLQHGASAHLKNGDGYPPLITMTASNKLALVAAMLQANVDPNLRANNGNSALHVASSLEMAQLLIDFGADVHARDNNGDTPLHCISDPAIITLLLQNTADADARDRYGATPLHQHLIRNPHITIPDVLLDHMSDPNCPDHLGTTPLHRLVSSVHIINRPLFLRLLAYGADPTSVLSTLTDKRITFDLVSNHSIQRPLASRVLYRLRQLHVQNSSPDLSRLPLHLRNMITYPPAHIPPLP